MMRNSQKFFPDIDNVSYKIIFLDIDGVIYSSDDRKRGAIKNIKSHQKILNANIKLDILNQLDVYDIFATLYFDEKSINCLKKLCEEPNTKIVISSNWRDRGIEKLKALFSIWQLDDYIIDITPELDDERSEEIEEWLFKNKTKVKAFVILDDDDENELRSNFEDRFIFIKEKLLNDDHYYVIKKQLEKPVRNKKLELQQLLHQLNENSKELIYLHINPAKLIVLKQLQELEYPIIISNLIDSLTNNTNLTHIVLNNLFFHKGSFNHGSKNEIYGSFISKLASILPSLIKLEILDLSDNLFLKSIFPILNILHKTNINHLCLNRNIYLIQEEIGGWLFSYNKPLKIQLDFKNSRGGKVRIKKILIEAMLKNDKITLKIDDLLEKSVSSDMLNLLKESGRLEIGKKEQPLSGTVLGTPLYTANFS